jgi:4,5-dihydroxyphthalate decarboxylase
VKANGFDTVFEASVFDSRSSRRLRGEVEEKYAGTEQVLTDYIVRIARGIEPNLVALPVFVTRGMVHRKLVMRRGSLRPQELQGRAVGMGRVLGATSVFLRGLLADDFKVERSKVKWVAAEPITSDPAMAGEWTYLSERGRFKASEMVARLSAGELDAVIYPGGAGGHWFNWVAAGPASGTPDPYGDLEQMVANSSDLCFPAGDVETHVDWFRRTRIYPLYHCLAVRRQIVEQNPALPAALVEAFDRAATAAIRYLMPSEKRLYESEIGLLGVDPNRCGLSGLHKRTVEKCIDYLEADGLLPQRPSIKDVFPLS